MNYRPLLSATLEDPLRLTWPVLVSPKLDGLRCIIKDGIALSRNLKPFRNKYVQECLRGLPNGLDGELIVGEPNVGNVLGRTQSGIMSSDGEPDFRFHVFDNFDQPDRAFKARHWSLHNVQHSKVIVVPHYLVEGIEDFAEYEKNLVDYGYEGVMIRGIYGHYKFGRATHNDQLLWKFKRFSDTEAIVTKLEEGVSNNNIKTVDALGLSKRSHHQDGMVNAGRVGTILATVIDTGMQLRVSPGNMTAEDRVYYWNRPTEIVGKTITVKYFEYGMKDQPRFSTFKAFRDAT
jgi:DNA ligase 1